ncbi:hypothetical protein COT98_03235 [Candidatus Falkowbacteria bacterium CG10_big_fil_rev_8_21_14_0_10_39_9]|uniref:Uncharacterized protein n=1 Tax=Candidatus Falkowbacteria bacterium CG10_big_fil_rev_8_21_14_0_10_39_9 TaxID=1974566 RepID=A0A2M6WP47_9BACT|nr:MAG: hypothetical protein COT98_03235 [Candidatus Falkowbacteria bacterium CG10_big_fil_rev_8_21_14_0_10_39_9]
MGFGRFASIETAVEQSGVALERELLGEMDERKYQELATEALAREAIKAEGLHLSLKEIKARSRAKYEEINDKAASEFLQNKHNPILSPAEMFDCVKKSQPGGPDRPFIADMKKALVARLKVEDKDVKFSSALGSNADYCGVDGIFTVVRQGHTFDIAIDITKKTKEEKNLDISQKMARGGKYLGDAIFSFSNREDDYVPERDADLIPVFVKEIIDVMRRQISEHNAKIK